MKKWSLRIGITLVALIALVVGVGFLIPEGHVASTSIRLDQPVDTVWRVVRNFESYDDWWSSVERVEPLETQDGREGWTQYMKTGPIPLEVSEDDPPHRLVTRMAEGLPFGGTWTYEVSLFGDGSRVSVTEDGEIYNPVFRTLSRFVFGYHATQESYLKALGDHFGQEVELERLR